MLRESGTQTTLMQAIHTGGYGPPERLQLRQTPTPVLSDEGVLVRVHAAALNPLELHMQHGIPYLLRLSSGLRTPKYTGVGSDLAGDVVAVGQHVTEFQPGDRVFGTCKGALAEYVDARPNGLVHMPAQISFEEAAAVPIAAFTALQALQKPGPLQAGQRVLVNGASGGVGTFAVQIARAYGALVTGVCSGRNTELVRSLGAEQVIDYTREDFTKQPAQYDLIVDCIANRSLRACVRILKPSGSYVGVGAAPGNWIGPLMPLIKQALLGRFVQPRLMSLLAARNKADLITLKELLEAGKLKPVIDRVYPLAETSAAMRYLATGRARGKVILTITR